jgi:DNA gyrase subunit B
VKVKRGGKIYFQRYRRGNPEEDLKVVGTADPNETGTRVTFMPDSEIFETTTFSYDTLFKRLRELAFLNKGIKITIKDYQVSSEQTT